MMKGNGFEIMDKIKYFLTFYFIESHLKSMNNEISVVLDSSGKHLNSFRKIIENEFKDCKNEEYIVSVYGINFKPALIKQKEIKFINGVPTITIKVVLKFKKNKFESHNNIRTDNDSFIPKIKFEVMKKVIGKDLFPPEQLILTNFQIIQLFSDALLIKEKVMPNDNTYMELMQYGVNLLNSMEQYELLFFLMIYINIVNNYNLNLIQKIFECFNLKKIII